MPRVSVALSIALLFALLSSVSCSSSERQRGTPPLRVGSDLDNPPFASLGADGRPTGRDVEMMEHVAKLLGRELVWEQLPFRELVDACEAGRVDVVCATLGITPERARRVRFTRGYFATELAVLVRADGGIASLEDLVGRRVAAGPGTTSEKALYGKLRFAHAVVASDAELLLERGEVDAVVLDGPAAAQRAARSRGRLAVLPQSLGAETYALAVGPEAHELQAELDRALAALQSSGTLAELDRRYGLTR